MTEAATSIEFGENLTLRKAGINDLDDTWAVIKSCSDWLKSKGMDHWDKYYSKDLIAKKLEKQEVYNVWDGDNLAGTVTLDTRPVEYYTDDDMRHFADPEAQAMYVTALAVAPERQGKGIASKLMEFAEREAQNKNIGYIRFDCRASYTQLVDFYKKRGYGVVGQILDDQDNNEPYYLMEKKLPENQIK